MSDARLTAVFAAMALVMAMAACTDPPADSEPPDAPPPAAPSLPITQAPPLSPGSQASSPPASSPPSVAPEPTGSSTDDPVADGPLSQPPPEDEPVENPQVRLGYEFLFNGYRGTTVGGHHVHSLALKNGSDTPLAIGQLSIFNIDASAAFSLTPDGTTCSGPVPPLEKCAIKVSFAPTKVGTHNAVLRVLFPADNSFAEFRLQDSGIPVGALPEEPVTHDGPVPSDAPVAPEEPAVPDAPANPENPAVPTDPPTLNAPD